MHDHRSPRPTYDPHGYQPLVVDENCLSNEDCREAVLEAFEHPGDWKSYLTPNELEELEKALIEIEASKSPYIFYVGEPPEMSSTRAEAARLGMFRAFARDKYAGGYGIWFGDGVPFQKG